MMPVWVTKDPAKRRLRPGLQEGVIQAIYKNDMNSVNYKQLDTGIARLDSALR